MSGFPPAGTPLADPLLLAAIVESSEDAIVGKNLAGLVTSWNHGAETLYGYSRQEMLGRPINILLPPDRQDEEASILQQIGLGLRYEPFETTRLTKSGRLLNVSLTISPIRDETGAIVGASHVARDITERAHLSRLTAQLAAIVESSQDAIVGKSLDGIVESWNGGAQKLYGYTAAEIVGKSMNVLLPPDRPDEERDILRRIRNGERVDHYETVRVTKSGSLVTVSLSVSPIRNSQGVVEGASHVARDITGQREFESRMQQVQKLESLGVLAGGIAHDFNNLLTGILGNASLALDHGPRISPVRVYLEDVIKAAERAATLTRQLLAYAGKGSYVIEKINLSDLITETCHLIEASIPRTVRVLLELDRSLPLVQGDVGQLQQVVMNLVINGAEAIGEKNGSVIVRDWLQDADDIFLSTVFAGCDLRPGKYLSVEVHDNGCGMTEAVQARIFEPFFTTKFTGRGLGLAAVLGIVRSHGGALKVYSTLGEGSTFKMLLPVLPEDIEASVAARAESDPLKGRGHLLVVDDEEMIGRFAQNALTHYGYSASLARGGEEAIRLFENTPETFRLVLLDLTMPGMSGEEVFRRLRSIRPDIPVLLTSGFSMQAAVRHFTGKGLAGFIQKPYSAKQLAAGIRDVLNPASTSPPPA